MGRLNDLLATIIGKVNQIDSKDTAGLASAKSYTDTQINRLSAKIPARMLKWCGEWDENESYYPNDAVSYNGSSYYAEGAGNVAIPSGISPDDDPGTWIILAAKGKDGTNGVDGHTPVKGTDYFTAADKTEMINAVIADLPVYDGSII